MTYHLSDMASDTSGAGTVISSGASEFTPGFVWVYVVDRFLCSLLWTIAGFFGPVSFGILLF